MTSLHRAITGQPGNISHQKVAVQSVDLSKGSTQYIPQQYDFWTSIKEIIIIIIISVIIIINSIITITTNQST